MNHLLKRTFAAVSVLLCVISLGQPLSLSFAESPGLKPVDTLAFFHKKVIIIDRYDHMVFDGQIKEMNTIILSLYEHSDYLTTIDGVDYHHFTN